MSRRLYTTAVAVLVGASLIGLLVYGISTQSPSRTLDDAVAKGLRPTAPRAGERLPLLSGAGRASLASFHGKVVILNFWASWCEPCQQEAPRLERTERELAKHNGTVLGVTYKDATTDSTSFVDRYHLTYPSLRDPTGEFAGSYGTDALPESFLIDRDGHIVAIRRGEAGEAFLQRAITLAEQS